MALLTLAVRGAALWLAPDAFADDPDAYGSLAENVWRHSVLGVERTPSAYRPPLYPLMLAPGFAFGERNCWYFGAWHVLLGVGTAMLSWRLAIRAGLGGWSVLAGLLVAADPILVKQSTVLMTETLAAFLTTLAWLAFCRFGDRPVVGRAALAGAALGLAALCRPTYLAAAPLAALIVFWRGRSQPGNGRNIIALAAALTAVLTPWCVRNLLALGKPIVSTTHGGYTLLLGNNDLFYTHLETRSWRIPWSADELDARVHANRLATGSVDEVALDHRDYEEALSHIRALPGTFLRACLLRAVIFWDVAPRGDTGASAFRIAVAVWYAAEWLAALAGAWLLTRTASRGEFAWGLALVAAFMLTHAVYWCDMRMRAPIAPVAAIAAAAGLRQFAERRPK